MKAVFIDRLTIGDIDLSPIEQAVDDLVCYDLTSPAQLVERCADADIIITNKAKVSAADMAQLPKLKLICITATGMDNVDLNAAKDHGIPVKNVAGYSTYSVAQHTITLLLALVGRLREYDRWTRAGNWQNQGIFTFLDYPIHELAGKKLGIIGYGDIGRRVDAIATALGMETMVAERPGQTLRKGRVDLNTMLQTAEVISLHCPLTAETKKLINAERIGLMRDDAVLLNTSRGALIDEAALAQAMNKGKFSGVGLDVLSTEPPPADNPLLQVKHPNFILTPHTAWGSVEARTRLIGLVADNIMAYLQNRP